MKSTEYVNTSYCSWQNWTQMNNCGWWGIIIGPTSELKTIWSITRNWKQRVRSQLWTYACYTPSKSRACKETAGSLFIMLHLILFNGVEWIAEDIMNCWKRCNNTGTAKKNVKIPNTRNSRTKTDIGCWYLQCNSKLNATETSCAHIPTVINGQQLWSWILHD